VIEFELFSGFVELPVCLVEWCGVFVWLCKLVMKEIVLNELSRAFLTRGS
jgi:hypothetical protein